jgi:hypothetical protein
LFVAEIIPRTSMPTRLMDVSDDWKCQQIQMQLLQTNPAN